MCSESLETALMESLGGQVVPAAWAPGSSISVCDQDTAPLLPGLTFIPFEKYTWKINVYNIVKRPPKFQTDCRKSSPELLILFLCYLRKAF